MPFLAAINAGFVTSRVVLPGTGGGGGGGGGSSDTLVENSTFVNAIASASDSNHTYSMASANISGDFADMKRIATNGTYTIVGDPNISVYHTGTGTTGTNQEVAQAGWIWIVRNSDGAIVKSCNSILNGDHNDSANIEQQTRGGVSSIGIEANIGYSVAINDNYAFTFAGFRLSGSGTSENFDDNRAYLFAYDLSDFSLAKVWKVNEFASTIDGYVGAPAYSSFTSGFGEHGMFATNDSLYIPSGYTAHTSNTNYPGGAVSYFDISDANPSNWTNPTVFKTPLTVNTTTNIGGSNYSNGNFGASGVYVYGTQVLVTHATRVHNYTRSGTSFSETSVYTPTYYIGENYNIPLSNGNVAMVTGDQTSKTLTVRDPANSWSQEWQVTLPGNGFPGYNVLIDAANDKLFTADSSHDGNGTDDGLITVYDADGTVNQTIQNPVSTNTRFGSGFSVHNGKLASKVRVGGVSTDLAIQFMDVPSYDPGGGGGSAQWWGTRGMAVGGQQPSNTNIMQYFDITTTGNAQDFGDMTTTDANASAGGNGTRGVRIGGNLNNTTMDYWAFATLGNATDFGDTNTAKGLSATVADGTKAITGGASVSGYQNSIEYITVDTTGAGTDFGDLLGAEGNIAGTNDTTRGIFAGGSQTADVIQYITMATPGNAIDFGDLLGNTSNMLTGTVSDNTSGVFQGGVSGGYSNVIQYITIQSAGNSTDFGDLAQARAYGGQTSDATSKRGVTLGGYVNPGSGGVALDSMEYITIDTPGNAADFGDLTGGNERAAGVSGSPGGGGGGGASLNWGGDRAIIWGNNEGSNDGIAIDYFDITTPGNAADFGDVHRQVDGFGPGKYEGSCVSDTTYGVYAGGKSSYNLNSTNQIDYITIGTLGNSATFGNLTTKTHKRPASASDGTTGYFSGGQDDYNVTYYTGTDTITIATQGNATLSSFVLATGIQYTTGTQDTSRMLISGGYTNGNTNNDLIQYLTFASAGTSQTFGNLTINRAQAAAVSDNTYALIGGGYDSANLLQSTDVVTIQTTGNATNFGNLTSAKRNLSAVSNGTYGCFCAGWSNLVDIDRFTIATAGNATDFGDLIGGGEAPGACSGSAS